MDLFWRSSRRTRDRTLRRSLLWFYLACLVWKMLTILSRNKIVGLKQSGLLLGWWSFWKRKRHNWGYRTIHTPGKMVLSHILGVFFPNVQRAVSFMYGRSAAADDSNNTNPSIYCLFTVGRHLHMLCHLNSIATVEGAYYYYYPHRWLQWSFERLTDFYQSPKTNRLQVQLKKLFQ